MGRELENGSDHHDDAGATHPVQDVTDVAVISPQRCRCEDQRADTDTGIGGRLPAVSGQTEQEDPEDEAVALGVPAYTTFAGKLGAVDAGLISEGRLLRLDRADDVTLGKRAREESPPLRDPKFLIDLILAVARRRD